MKKTAYRIILLVLAAVIALALGSCDPTDCTHADDDGDGFCDSCQAELDGSGSGDESGGSNEGGGSGEGGSGNESGGESEGNGSGEGGSGSESAGESEGNGSGEGGSGNESAGSNSGGSEGSGEAGGDEGDCGDNENADSSYGDGSDEDENGNESGGSSYGDGSDEDENGSESGGSSCGDSSGESDSSAMDDIMTYQEFQARWYSKKFLDNFGFSYSSELLNGLESDTYLFEAYEEWKSIHLIADPSYETGEMKKKDLYMLAIYDILSGEGGGYENPLELVSGECTKYVYGAVKTIFGSEDINMDALKSIDPKLHKQTLLNSKYFGALDAVGTIFDTYENLFDALNACAQYEAISNMDVGFKNILAAIGQDAECDKHLRDAAEECIEYFENACSTTLEQIMAKKFTEYTAKDMIRSLYGEALTTLVKAVFPPYIAIQFASQGVVVLGNALFNLDETNQALCKLQVAVELENSIRRILEKDDFKLANENTFETYMYGIEMFQRAVVLGGEYSADLLESRLGSAGLTSALEEKYYGELNNIYNFISDRWERYGYVEYVCQLAYETYCRAISRASRMESNGHYYDVIYLEGVDSWEAAQDFCELIGGHLATITSAEEDNFIYDLMLSNNCSDAFFGFTDKDREGTWVWVTGESVTYTNWHEGEPNQLGDENYGMYYYEFTDGTWNDGARNATYCFICEWDKASTGGNGSGDEGNSDDNENGDSNDGDGSDEDEIEFVCLRGYRG